MMKDNALIVNTARGAVIDEEALIEELKTGNVEFAKAKETVLHKLHEMNMPCVEDFLKEFMPSFEVTLDELNEK